MSMTTSMKIRQLEIERFKAIRSARFMFDPAVNVLTGPNNSGKTTVLEAIALWAECFRLILRQAGRAVTDRHIERGEWHLDREIIAFNRISSVRSPGKDDLFFNLDTSQGAIKLQATLSDGATELTIPISIRAARGSMYEIICDKGHSKGINPVLNRVFQAFPDPVNVIYASPVAALQAIEEFATPPKIRRELQSRASILVLRNRLYGLSRDVSRYTQLLDDVSYVLTGRSGRFEVEIRSDATRDVVVRCEARLGRKDVLKDLSLLGSGTLQLIELLLSLHEPPRDVNIVLLDEPDSHIHRDIQRRLMERLRLHADHAQLFMTTHNESLIRSAEPRHVFYLHGVSTGRREFRPVLGEKLPTRKQGLQPSPTLSILEALGHESALDLLNALEADHFFLTEGRSDAAALDVIVRNRRMGVEPRVMCWCFDGINNALTGLRVYSQIFSQIKNGTSLWEKAIVVLDRDFLTPTQGTALADALSRTKGINARVHIWPAYSIESTLLSEGAGSALVELLAVYFDGQGEGSVARSRLRRALGQSISTLADELGERIDEDWFQKRVIGQLTERRNLLATVYGSSSIAVKALPAENRLWVEFCAEQKARLDRGEVHHLATKEDVARVIHDTARALDPDAFGLGETPKVFAQSLPWFETVIGHVTRNTWLPIWDGLFAELGEPPVVPPRSRVPPKPPRPK